MLEVMGQNHPINTEIPAGNGSDYFVITGKPDEIGFQPCVLWWKREITSIRLPIEIKSLEQFVKVFRELENYHTKRAEEEGAEAKFMITMVVVFIVFVIIGVLVL